MFKKRPAIQGKIIGCACCGGNKHVYPLNFPFAVGFGYSGIRKDGESIYEESGDEPGPRLQKFESMALDDPDHDWTMYRKGPLKSSVYQRHGDGLWMLVEEDEGFA